MIVISRGTREAKRDGLLIKILGHNWRGSRPLRIADNVEGRAKGTHRFPCLLAQSDPYLESSPFSPSFFFFFPFFLSLSLLCASLFLIASFSTIVSSGNKGSAPVAPDSRHPEIEMCELTHEHHKSFPPSWSMAYLFPPLYAPFSYNILPARYLWSYVPLHHRELRLLSTSLTNDFRSLLDTNRSSCNKAARRVEHRWLCRAVCTTIIDKSFGWKPKREKVQRLGGRRVVLSRWLSMSGWCWKLGENVSDNGTIFLKSFDRVFLHQTEIISFSFHKQFL